MKTTAKNVRAYAFPAALGVMAVAFLVVFAMGQSTQFSYHMTGLTFGRLQERYVVQAGIDQALARLAAGDDRIVSEPERIQLLANDIRGTLIEIVVQAARLEAGHPLYGAPGLTHRAGDVLVRVDSAFMQDRYGFAGRSMLCNTSGARSRPIDVTAVAGPARGGQPPAGDRPRSEEGMGNG